MSVISPTNVDYLRWTVMEYIPEEIISHILKYLSLSDRKEAALVCKKWYEASLDPMLLKDTVVTFHAPTSTASNFDKLGYRKAPHLILDQIDGSFSSKQFLLNQSGRLTDNLLSLSLKGSNITENLFTALLQKCSRLEALDVSCCNSLFMSGLVLSKPVEVEKVKQSLTNLKSLNLSNIRYLSDTTLNRITSLCSELQNLYLAGNQIIFHSEKYYSRCSSSDAMLTFNNILTILSKRATQLKVLDFSRTAINDDGLSTLSMVKDLELVELYLVCCREVYDTGVLSLTRKQLGLKILDLSQCSDISDQSLCAICENLHQLKILRLNKCVQLTDSAVKRLHMIDTLERLEIASIYTITSKALTLGLCKGKLPHLYHLNLNCCTLVKDSFIIQMCKQLNFITYLDLGSTGITDIGLTFICTYLVKLKNLYLSWCREITNKGLLGEALEENMEHYIDHEDDGNCKCTRKQMGVNILNLPKINQEKKVKTRPLEDPCTINNIQGLLVLDVTSCPRITDKSIVEIKLPELRHLRLGMNNGVTDVSLIALSKNCRSLEELNVSQCSEVSDAGVIPLVRSLRRLSALYISSCDKITDNGLQAIQSYGQRLQELDVSMCGKVTLKQLNLLESSMKHLHSVQKRLIGGF